MLTVDLYFDTHIFLASHSLLQISRLENQTAKLENHAFLLDLEGLL